MTRDADVASRQRASERRLRALLANFVDIVTISDRDGRIIYASPATQDDSGYTPQEFMTRNHFDSTPKTVPAAKRRL